MKAIKRTMSSEDPLCQQLLQARVHRRTSWTSLHRHLEVRMMLPAPVARAASGVDGAGVQTMQRTVRASSHLRIPSTLMALTGSARSQHQLLPRAVVQCEVVAAAAAEAGTIVTITGKAHRCLPKLLLAGLLRPTIHLTLACLRRLSVAPNNRLPHRAPLPELNCSHNLQDEKPVPLRRSFLDEQRRPRTSTPSATTIGMAMATTPTYELPNRTSEAWATSIGWIRVAIRIA